MKRIGSMRNVRYRSQQLSLPQKSANVCCLYSIYSFYSVYFPVCILFYGGIKGATKKIEFRIFFFNNTLIIVCSCCVVMLCLCVSSPGICWWCYKSRCMSNRASMPQCVQKYNKQPLKSISFLSYDLKLLSKISLKTNTIISFTMCLRVSLCLFLDQ